MEHLQQLVVLIEAKSNVKMVDGGIAPYVLKHIIHGNLREVGIAGTQEPLCCRNGKMQRSRCQSCLVVGKRLVRHLHAHQEFIGEMGSLANERGLCTSAVVEQEVTVIFAIPSPVDVVVITSLIAVAHELMAVAANDDWATLCQLLIEKVEPFVLIHIVTIYYRQRLLFIAEIAIECPGRPFRMRGCLDRTERRPQGEAAVLIQGGDGILRLSRSFAIIRQLHGIPIEVDGLQFWVIIIGCNRRCCALRPLVIVEHLCHGSSHTSRLTWMEFVVCPISFWHLVVVRGFLTPLGLDHRGDICFHVRPFTGRSLSYVVIGSGPGNSRLYVVTFQEALHGGRHVVTVDMPRIAVA